MDSTTAVGYAWRYLEIQGKMNAMAQKTTPRQTFFIEPEEDEDSLLRFTKEVIPHRELITPPQYVNQRQQLVLQRSQNTRLCSDPLALSTQIVRSSRQGADTEMTSNAFSNLDAIAQMGAGIDDHDPQQFSGQNTPVAMGNLSESNQIASSAQFQQNFEQRTGGGGIGRLPLPLHRIGMSSQQQQQMIHQMSPVEQQQQRLMIYKQQQQQKITSATYRSTPQTGAEVFDFDEPTSFGSNLGSPSYSPVVGGRRRGRGRRAGNMGDRQLSISSLENESSTPGSPSDYNPTRVGKRRAGGVPGQRKPRKMKRQEQDASNSFDNQFQQQYQQNMITQQSMMPDEFTGYDNSAPAQEEVRSRLVSQYEMGYESSSSSDEEMDPPPPPRNLDEFKSAGSDNKAAEMGKSAAQKTSISQQKAPISMQRQSQIQQQEPQNIQNETSEAKPQTTMNVEQTQPPILEDIKFSYASSKSSSPSQTGTPQPQHQSITANTQSDPNVESRKNSKIKLEEFSKEQEELKSLLEEKVNAVKKKKNAPILLDDLFDNGLDNTTVVKKESSEQPTKSSKQLEANSSKSKNSSKEQNVKNTTTKKQQTTAEESTKKPGKIVLKIKPPRDAKITTKNSSSSSPSSTSSSISASNFAQLIQMGDQPVRLSSSGAPPSKSKQQQNALQQQIRPSKKRPLDVQEEGTKSKKVRKSEESAGGRNSPRPTNTSSSSASLKTSTSGKSNNKNSEKSTTKELAPAAAPSITTSALPPFPSLKNFKIPKVVETSEPTPPTSNNNKSNQPDRSATAEKEGGRKSSTTTSSSSFGIISPSDNRRHGEKSGGGHSNKGGGHWEKGSNSYSNSSSHYNRQRQSAKPDNKRDHQRDHSSSRGAAENSSRFKKNANHPNDRSGGRGPPIPSRPPHLSYQQQPHQPPSQQSPREQHSGATFATQNWSPFSQQQQFMPAVYQGCQPKPPPPPQNWPPQQQMAQPAHQIYHQQQYRHPQIDDNPPLALTQQQRPNQEEKLMAEPLEQEEDRTDNSPSGDGLQIVDEE